MRQLDWLGLKLDCEANERGALRISAPDSKVGCYVIATDEELMIARHTWRTVSQRAETNVQELRA